MSPAYIKLSIATLLPVIATAILYLLDKGTRFGRIKRWKKQAIIGVIFGGLAIIGTEWGIPINGAQVNCRDAAVLVAGLLFRRTGGYDCRCDRRCGALDRGSLGRGYVYPCGLHGFHDVGRLLCRCPAEVYV